jgi:hypothetical protein
VFALLGVWMFISATEKMGLTVDSPPDVRRGATAQIQSCSSDALYMWLTWRCDARVQWQDETGSRLVSVQATHSLSGWTPVLERVVPRRGHDSTEVVSADYPVKVDGALFFVMMMTFMSLGLLGWFLGLKLAYRLPEPPPKNTTLNLRMQSRILSGRSRRKPR